MNSISFMESSTFEKNWTSITIESWFIPFDVFRIVSITLAIILTIIFVLIIAGDKSCHTVPMMLTANSCLAALVFECGLLSMCIFTFENDLRQIKYQDSLCVFRAYVNYATCAMLFNSFLLQAIYRYITVVYPTRLHWQAARFQALLICLVWIFSFSFPTVYMFTNKIIYNVDNQICQLPLELSFSTFYNGTCVYIIPVALTIFVYFKLVRYVRKMNKRITLANTIARARRELKMVQRTVILTTALVILGALYAICWTMSFFTNPPKYHFRIGFMALDMFIVFVMSALLKFTDSLKVVMMKIITIQLNMIVPTIS